MTQSPTPSKLTLTHNLVDIHDGEIYPAKIDVEDGVIQSIERVDSAKHFVMPGFIDSHIHVESSMLLPTEFARVAVRHGTVATVSDPHEIANVCGVEGIELMLRNAAQSPFKFCFGAPACVPATEFETAGARLDPEAVGKLLADDRIGYLSEMMDFPGVLNGSPDVLEKINAAKLVGKPIDGHAPGLRGDEAARYVAVGISTDHECFTYEEAVDKLNAGCKIAIREGSAARNFEALQRLIEEHPDNVMLCSDDKHPDEFLLGHMDQLCARAVAGGTSLFKLLRVACLNPVEHYQLKVGLLRVGDPADFIVVDDCETFRNRQTYIDGVLVAENGKCLIPPSKPETINQFQAIPIHAADIQVPIAGTEMRVIEAIDGQLITRQIITSPKIQDELAVSDTARDILKIVVVNRYSTAPPAVAFIHGFGLKHGALASSVAHDSHNIVAVGTSDEELVAAINAVIEAQGGLSVASQNQVEVLPLPVAGLMSTDTCEVVGQQYSLLDQQVKKLGTNLRAPYMTLSFMSLLVIPSLKLSDKGLFDGATFELAPLFCQ